MDVNKQGEFTEYRVYVAYVSPGTGFSAVCPTLDVNLDGPLVMVGTELVERMLARLKHNLLVNIRSLIARKEPLPPSDHIDPDVPQQYLVVKIVAPLGSTETEVSIDESATSYLKDLIDAAAIMEQKCSQVTHLDQLELLAFGPAFDALHDVANRLDAIYRAKIGASIVKTVEDAGLMKP